jgi:hypothetical protein
MVVLDQARAQLEEAALVVDSRPPWPARPCPPICSLKP